jgi:5'-3' exonuclease
MYKYLGENTLMESMYFMMAQFRYYNIEPIFVFDGAAPAEKQAVLRSREANKATAQLKYNQTAAQLQMLLTMQEQQQQQQERHPGYEQATIGAVVCDGLDDCRDADRRRTILEHEDAMRGLRKRFIRVHGYELSDVKRLMRAFDMRYVEANGEADIMCAQIVKRGIAHACMSDDMDMFLYGCPRVLRYTNLIHGTCVEYDLHRILDLLDVSLAGLRKICILSGTDYNPDNFDPCMRCRIFLSDIYESYIDFRSFNTDDSEEIDDTAFYEWMKQTNWLFHHIDTRSLSRVFGLFSAELTGEQLLNLDNVLSKTAPRLLALELPAVSGSEQSGVVTPPVSSLSLSSASSTSSASAPFGIPIRVKKIMAQYNFIFI